MGVARPPGCGAGFGVGRIEVEQRQKPVQQWQCVPLDSQRGEAVGEDEADRSAGPSTLASLRGEQFCGGFCERAAAIGPAQVFGAAGGGAADRDSHQTALAQRSHQRGHSQAGVDSIARRARASENSPERVVRVVRLTPVEVEGATRAVVSARRSSGSPEGAIDVESAAGTDAGCFGLLTPSAILKRRVDAARLARATPRTRARGAGRKCGGDTARRGTRCSGSSA